MPNKGIESKGMPDDKRDLAQINAYVPAEMKKEFKLECLKAGTTMSDVITDLVSDWLESRQQSPAPEPNTGAKGKGKG